MKQIATKGENWDLFTLWSINLNMASISGTGNVQPIFNFDPCVLSICGVTLFTAKSRIGVLYTWSLRNPHRKNQVGLHHTLATLFAHS